MDLDPETHMAILKLLEDVMKATQAIQTSLASMSNTLDRMRVASDRIINVCSGNYSSAPQIESEIIESVVEPECVEENEILDSNGSGEKYISAMDSCLFSISAEMKMMDPQLNQVVHWPSLNESESEDKSVVHPHQVFDKMPQRNSSVVVNCEYSCSRMTYTQSAVKDECSVSFRRCFDPGILQNTGVYFKLMQFCKRCFHKCLIPAAALVTEVCYSKLDHFLSDTEFSWEPGSVSFSYNPVSEVLFYVVSSDVLHFATSSIMFDTMSQRNILVVENSLIYKIDKWKGTHSSVIISFSYSAGVYTMLKHTSLPSSLYTVDLCHSETVKKPMVLMLKHIVAWLVGWFPNEELHFPWESGSLQVRLHHCTDHVLVELVAAGMLVTTRKIWMHEYQKNYITASLGSMSVKAQLLFLYCNFSPSPHTQAQARGSLHYMDWLTLTVIADFVPYLAEFPFDGTTNAFIWDPGPLPCVVERSAIMEIIFEQSFAKGIGKLPTAFICLDSQQGNIFLHFSDDVSITTVYAGVSFLTIIFPSVVSMGVHSRKPPRHMMHLPDCNKYSCVVPAKSNSYNGIRKIFEEQFETIHMDWQECLTIYVLQWCVTEFTSLFVSTYDCNTPSGIHKIKLHFSNCSSVSGLHIHVLENAARGFYSALVYSYRGVWGSTGFKDYVHNVNNIDWIFILDQISKIIGCSVTQVLTDTDTEVIRCYDPGILFHNDHSIVTLASLSVEDLFNFSENTIYISVWMSYAGFWISHLGYTYKVVERTDVFSQEEAACEIYFTHCLRMESPVRWVSQSVSGSVVTQGTANNDREHLAHIFLLAEFIVKRTSHHLTSIVAIHTEYPATPSLCVLGWSGICLTNQLFASVHIKKRIIDVLVSLKTESLYDVHGLHKCLVSGTSKRVTSLFPFFVLYEHGRH